MQQEIRRKVFGGLDPGKHGSLGLLNYNGDFVEYFWFDNPDANDLAELFKVVQQTYDIQLIGLERVGPRPKEGVVSVATFAEHNGCIKGILAVLEIPFIEILPTTWKKIDPELKKLKEETKREGKKRSLLYAQKRWPEAGLKLIKHVDIADSLCIGECARRIYMTTREEQIEEIQRKKEDLLEKAREQVLSEKERKRQRLEQARENWRKSPKD